MSTNRTPPVYLHSTPSSNGLRWVPLCIPRDITPGKETTNTAGGRFIATATHSRSSPKPRHIFVFLHPHPQQGTSRTQDDISSHALRKTPRETIPSICNFKGLVCRCDEPKKHSVIRCDDAMRGTFVAPVPLPKLSVSRRCGLGMLSLTYLLSEPRNKRISVGCTTSAVSTPSTVHPHTTRRSKKPGIVHFNYSEALAFIWGTMSNEALSFILIVKLFLLLL